MQLHLSLAQCPAVLAASGAAHGLEAKGVVGLLPLCFQHRSDSSQEPVCLVADDAPLVTLTPGASFEV
jgi:hypothetical protein